MAGLVWLASYPKSGNTWTRAFLSHVFDIAPLSFEHFDPDRNGLFGDPIASFASVFDDTMGLPAAEIGSGAVDRLRFPFHRDLALELAELRPGHPPLIKTHEAFGDETGTARFRRPETERAIVLIRNPLDIAVSYASHLQQDIDKTIARMGQSHAAFSAQPNVRPPPLSQIIGSWSHHVASWTQQDDVPVLVVRYEDLLDHPARGFGDMLRFLGRTVVEDRVQTAIEATAFDRLAAGERKGRGAHVDRAFFRRGVSGDWQDHLTRDQVLRVVQDHAKMMDALGYLRPARDWLSADAQSTAKSAF